MKKFRIFACAIAFGLAMAATAAPVYAQKNAQSAFNPKGSSSKPVWFKGQVVRADGHSITVRESEESLTVYTFTFSPGIQDAMWKLLERGGYQYGDKVSVLHQPGQTVALKIRGKPSKPL